MDRNCEDDRGHEREEQNLHGFCFHKACVLDKFYLPTPPELSNTTDLTFHLTILFTPDLTNLHDWGKCMREFLILSSIPLLQLDLAGSDAKISGAPLTTEPPRNQCREYWDMTEEYHSMWDPRRERIKRILQMVFGVWLS